MKISKVFFGDDDKEIAGFLYSPNERNLSAIIICHGFTGRGKIHKRLDRIARNFCKNGFIVLRFYFRGSGESKGKLEDVSITSEVEDLKSAINFLWKHGYRRVGVLGLSLGGAITVLSYSKKVKAIVLWNPVLNLKQFFTNIIGGKELKTKEEGNLIVFKDVKSGKEFKIGKNFLKELKIISLGTFLRKIKCPILILHGDKDNAVPAAQSKTFLKFIRSKIKKTKIVKGASHNFEEKLHEKLAIDLTLQWFNKWLLVDI